MAGLRAVVFFVTLALEADALRVGLVTVFFAGFVLLLARAVSLIAFRAGAFAPETRFAIDFGLADLVLSALLFVAGLEVERLVAGRRIFFVTGLLMRNQLKAGSYLNPSKKPSAA